VKAEALSVASSLLIASVGREMADMCCFVLQFSHDESLRGCVVEAVSPRRQPPPAGQTARRCVFTGRGPGIEKPRHALTDPPAAGSSLMTCSGQGQEMADIRAPCVCGGSTCRSRILRYMHGRMCPRKKYSSGEQHPETSKRSEHQFELPEFQITRIVCEAGWPNNTDCGMFAQAQQTL